MGEAGMRPSREDVLFIGKLVSAYFKSTPQGKMTALKFLNCAPKTASTLRTYFKAGYLGQEDQKLKPRDLMEFKGWVYKGTNTVRHEGIEIDEREDAVICDNCGGRFPEDYCMSKVETVKRTGETRNEMWCNHCRISTEDHRIRQASDQRVCAGCEKVTCEFHPKHHTIPQQGVALLPQRSTATGPSENITLPPGWEKSC